MKPNEFIQFLQERFQIERKKTNSIQGILFPFRHRKIYALTLVLIFYTEGHTETPHF